MNIERALTIPGWSSEEELTFLAECASKSKVVIEIGSWRGRTARAMADNFDGELYCVDTFANNAYGNPGWWTENDGPDFCKQPDWLWNAFLDNMQDTKATIRPMRMTSLEGAQVLSHIKADLVFIDAGHDLQNVMNDIRVWRPLLADGGIFCGHDFHEHTNPEVVQAVKELIGEVKVVDTIWIAN
jgi:predicted O-methyltransferase YrrM